jgi:gliding motility-associated protein GldM
MAGGKLNARQKMINMMYLVLTALLALNVAKEVLNAFVIINMGLLQQKESIEHKNEAILTEFSNQRIIDSANTRLQFLDSQAIYINRLSGDLISDIEKMKVEMVVKVDKVNETKALDLVKNPMKVDRKDDYDGPTRFFGTNNPPGATGRAHDLKIKINEFRKNCITVVDKVLEDPMYNTSRVQIKAEISSELNILLTNDPKDNKEYPTWEMQYFYHLPLSAALTELTKWQNFVEGAESDMLNFLWKEISRNVYKFDKIKVAVIPKSNFVTSGSNFEADVFLAAYSTNGGSLPTITYGSTVDTGTMKVPGGIVLSKDKFVDGVGKVSFPVSGSGEKTFAGTLQMTDPSGNIKTLPFSTVYNVAPPSATISPSELNVVYYGTNNPFSISVPGVASNNIIVSASGATVTGSNGKYVINPVNTTGKITVSVSARMQDGTTQRMGTQEFRIKRVPDPEILIAGKKSGSTINKDRLLLSPIIPDMSGFLFPVYANVLSVKGSVKDASGNYVPINFTGNQFDAETKRKIKAAPDGSKLYLEEIRVSVPGGNRTMTCFYILSNH